MASIRQIISNSPSIDHTGIEERVARLNKRSIKTSSKKSALLLSISMMDLTTLDAKDTPGKVKQLCAKAIRPHDTMDGTAFPSGMSTRDVKLRETKYAVAEGADEIDMVISRGHFLAGEYNFVFDEIAAVKEACGEAHLKVILETGELSTLDAVRKASDLAMHAGADFIKTSTGKVQPAATLPVTLVMLEAIRDYYYDYGKMIGMKPAGGIATVGRFNLHTCRSQTVPYAPISSK